MEVGGGGGFAFAYLRSSFFISAVVVSFAKNKCPSKFNFLKYLYLAVFYK